MFGVCVEWGMGGGNGSFEDSLVLGSPADSNAGEAGWEGSSEGLEKPTKRMGRESYQCGRRTSPEANCPVGTSSHQSAMVPSG